MSDSELDVIREVNEAVATRNLGAITARLHPDAVWEHNIGTGSPEEGVHRGRDSVLRLFERIVETWEYIRPEPRSIDRLDRPAALAAAGLTREQLRLEAR